MCLKSRSALLAEMRQKNVAPDIRTYTLVFASCTSKTEFQILMEEVSAAGFPVDLKACYAILNAMIRSNCDAFEILRTFDDLRDKWKIQPDKKMLQQLIKVHKACGNSETAQELIVELKKRHPIFPSRAAASSAREDATATQDTEGSGAVGSHESESEG